MYDLSFSICVKCLTFILHPTISLCLSKNPTINFISYNYGNKYCLCPHCSTVFQVVFMARMAYCNNFLIHFHDYSYPSILHYTRNRVILWSKNKIICTLNLSKFYIYGLLKEPIFYTLNNLLFSPLLSIKKKYFYQYIVIYVRIFY